MTAEEIKEYNKLCAEFLGWEYHKGHFINPLGGTPLTLKPDELRFHEDWNWIMIILDKIESLSSNQLVIDWSRRNKNIYDLKLTESSLETVTRKLYEFLNWYKTK